MSREWEVSVERRVLHSKHAERLSVVGLNVICKEEENILKKNQREFDR